MAKKTDTKEDTKDTGVAQVIGRKGVIREYTLERHGKDYKKLAESFAFKNGYRVV